MGEKNKLIYSEWLILAALLSFFLVACNSSPSADDQPVNTGPGFLEKHYCSENDRNAFCIEVYDPVCGWFSPEIKCVRYPCAQDYSNACHACSDPKVSYWTEGPCPP